MGTRPTTGFETDESSYTTVPGFNRPVIEKGRPPVDLVTNPKSGLVLFTENPRAEIPSVMFRIISHPGAGPNDFLKEIGENDPRQRGVTTAFAKPIRMAKIYLNNRNVYFRTDIRPRDRNGNTVFLEAIGKDTQRRDVFPWDLLCIRLQRILVNGALALTKDIDVGIPIEWYRFLETTRWDNSPGIKKRVPLGDIEDAKLRDEFAMSGQRLLMQGILFLDLKDVPTAESDKFWPMLKKCKHQDHNGYRMYYGVLFSPPAVGVAGMLRDIFTKKDKMAPVSIINSKMGDIYTYQQGAYLNIGRMAKDPAKPMAELNITYDVSAGMPWPLAPEYGKMFRDFGGYIRSTVNGTVTAVTEKEIVVAVDVLDDPDAPTHVSIDITGFEPVVTVGATVSNGDGKVAGTELAYNGIIAPQPYIEDHLESIMALLEDAEIERSGEGSKFLEANLNYLRSMVKGAFTGSSYFSYLPQRVQDAVDLVPEELTGQYRTVFFDPKTNKEREGKFYEYLHTLPTKNTLSDKWMSALANSRRAANTAPQATSRAGLPPPPAPNASGVMNAAPTTHNPAAPVPPPTGGMPPPPSFGSSMPPPPAFEPGEDDGYRSQPSVPEATSPFDGEDENPLMDDDPPPSTTPDQALPVAVPPPPSKVNAPPVKQNLPTAGGPPSMSQVSPGAAAPAHGLNASGLPPPPPKR